MKFPLILVIVALIGFSIYGQQKLTAARKQAAALLEEAAVIRGNLDNAEMRLEESKRQAGETTKKLAEGHEIKQQLAETQRKLEEAAKRVADVESGSEGLKKLTLELDALKKQADSTASQLATAKQEVVTAQAQTTSARAEVQRLQQLQSRPVLGTTMDKKRQ